MSIITCVLEQPLGENAEGTCIQLEQEVAEALISAGIAREATSEDLAGGEDEEEEVTEAEDEGQSNEPQVATDAVRRLAADAKQTVQKAVNDVAVKLAKAHTAAPTNRFVAGSDHGITGGFKNIGEFVLNAQERKKGNFAASKRWSAAEKAMRAKAPMSISGSHVGSDLVPQQWADHLFKLAFDNVPDLVGMCNKFEMEHQVLKIPAWVQASAASAVTSGVVGETSAITQTAGVTATVTLTLKKAAALVSITDELMRFNAYSLTNVLEQIVPQRIRYTMNDDVVNGTNGGANLVGNGTTIAVPRAVSGHFSFMDVLNMYAHMFDDFVPGACWLINQSATPELYSLAYPNRTATTQFPVFLPGSFGQSLSPAPLGELMGLPVYRLENVPALGTTGDLILFNPKSIASGYTSLFADQTKALYFNLAEDSYRFLWYFDEQSMLTSVYTRKDGSTASNVVVLSGSTS